MASLAVGFACINPHESGTLMDVFFVAYCLKVRRVYTRSVVADVVNFFSGRYFALVQLE